MRDSYFRAALLLRLAAVLIALSGFASKVNATALTDMSNTANKIQSTLCSVYNLVHNVIFLLGLVLMVLGAALYASGTLAPTLPKGAIQGYGMGMIMGGVGGVIITLLAPFVLGMLTGNTNIAAAC